MWVKQYLQHLQTVHSNSLSEESPTVQSLPQTIKVPLHEHQRAVLHRMEELEQRLASGYDVSGDQIFANYGILGDSVGAGKSLMVLSHIARMNALQPIAKTYSMHPHSSPAMFSITTRAYTDISEVGSLIIVPHTLFRQWADYIKKQTTLKALCVGRITDVGADEFVGRVQAADVVLVSNTLMKHFWPRCRDAGLRWKRVFLDEADTIHLPGMTANHMPPARFYWFVTASWLNLIFQNTSMYLDKHYINTRILTDETYKHFWAHFRSILSSQSYYAYVSHSVKSSALLREMLSIGHPMRSHVVIKCSDAFIQSSISLPPLLRSVLWCKAPISHRLIQNVLPAQLQQMLHAGDVTTALETLGVKGQDSKTLVEAVTANLRKELDRLERTYEFKAGLEYSSEAAKQTALANLTEKINKTKDSIKGIEERIAAIGTEMCPICYDDPAEPLVTPCCSRAFCAACLLMSMTRNPECPMCRAKIHPSACTKFVKEGNTIVETAAAAEEAPEHELLGKEETLLRLMRQNPEGRFLIFSRYDNPFEGIERRVTELGVVVRQLKGNKDAIAGTLKAFDGGSARCLLLNSRFAGSGLNITAATHVVLLHAMTHEEEKQILGRAYRMGRKGALNFVKLLNKGEESYAEGD